MLDRICKTLRIAAAALAGAWAGYALWQWWDFFARPGLYAMQSAPWYTGVLLCGAAAAVLVLVLPAAAGRPRRRPYRGGRRPAARGGGKFSAAGRMDPLVKRPRGWYNSPKSRLE